MTMEAFGAEIGVHRDTLLKWTAAQPDFAEAKKLGECHREKYLLEMGYALVTGAYEKGKAAAWIFMVKNMMGWRDKKDVNVGGQPDGVPVVTMTRDERLAEIKRLQALRVQARAEADE